MKIDKITKNPYNMNNSIKIVSIDKSDKDHDIKLGYEFKFEPIGDIEEKQLSLTCGYKEDKENNLSFIFNENDIDKIINELNRYKENIYKYNSTKDTIKEYHSMINTWIEKEYIDYIEVENTRQDSNSYGIKGNNNFVFKITPIFTQEAVSNKEDIIVGFNFIEIIHVNIMDPRSYSNLKNYITGNNSIDINFTNFDIHKLVDKKRKEIMSKVKNTDMDNSSMFSLPESTVRETLKDFNIPYEDYEKAKRNHERLKNIK